MAEKEKKVAFAQILTDLKDDSRLFPPRYLHRFSDLDRRDLHSLQKAWGGVSENRKVNLLQDLEELSDSETLVCFDDVARIGLSDPSPAVRAISARLLWESEDVTLIPIFLNMMEKDVDTEARAAGAAALGRFILIGEIEELSPETKEHLEDSLLLVCTGVDAPSVRRRALESLGYSERQEVPVLIEKALASTDRAWTISALFAISRSVDQRWEKQVLKFMKHPDDDIRFEAIRAAGELELESARQPLLDMLESGEEEGENRVAVAWSLSQIGGDEVEEALQKSLQDSEDEDEAEYIEEAITNLKFNQDFQLAGIMDIPDDDLDESDDINSRT
jgi:HEAT repeat protein